MIKRVIPASRRRAHDIRTGTSFGPNRPAADMSEMENMDFC